MPKFDILPSMMFATAANEFTITEVTEATAVNTSVKGADGSVLFNNTSTYYPDENGCIRLCDLGDLVCQLVERTFTADDIVKVGARQVGMQLLMDVTKGPLRSSRVLYMCKEMGELKPMFATCMRTRSVLPGMPTPVSILCAGNKGLKLTFAAAFKTDTGLLWKEAQSEVNTDADCFSFAADTNTVLNLLGGGSVTVDNLLFYTVTLSSDGKQVDGMRFSVDRDNNADEARHFLFYNLFGVPDSFTFKGRQTEEQSVDSDFGYAGRSYVQIDRLVTESHKSNTGWLSKEAKHAAYDFLDSPLTFVCDGETIRRITVTEVDSSFSRPSSEPDSLTVTWRFADKQHMRLSLVKPDEGRASTFAKPPFDKTFD